MLSIGLASHPHRPDKIDRGAALRRVVLVFCAVVLLTLAVSDTNKPSEFELLSYAYYMVDNLYGGRFDPDSARAIVKDVLGEYMGETGYVPTEDELRPIDTANLGYVWALGRAFSSVSDYWMAMHLFERVAETPGQFSAYYFYNIAAQYAADETCVQNASHFYIRAINLLEKTNDVDDPSVLELRIDLANLWLRAGENAKAESLYVYSLSLYEKALGEDHEAVGTVLWRLGDLYVRCNNLEAAEAAYKRAFGIHMLPSPHGLRNRIPRLCDSLISVLRRRGDHLTADLVQIVASDTSAGARWRAREILEQENVFQIVEPLCGKPLDLRGFQERFPEEMVKIGFRVDSLGAISGYVLHEYFRSRSAFSFIWDAVRTWRYTRHMQGVITLQINSRRAELLIDESRLELSPGVEDHAVKTGELIYTRPDVSHYRRWWRIRRALLN